MVQTQNLFEGNFDNARAHLKAHAAEGTSCPVCEQFVKLYKRKLNSAQAYALIGLVRIWIKSPDDYVQFTGKHKYRDGGGDFAKLRFWGLIEEKQNDDDKKRNSGYWKPTVKGCNFVNNKIRVASHVIILMGKVEGFTEETIDITDALGDKFDYTELMKGTA